MSFLDRIDDCRVFTPELYRPFEVDGIAVGLITPSFADRLAAFPEVFDVASGRVALSRSLSDPDSRTVAVEGVLRRLRDDGVIPGWRNEPYPVAAAFSAPMLMTIERAAVPLFGVRGYGVHLNGTVRTANGLGMWVARRSHKKQTEPGKLDQIVAGGQPAGLSLRANLIKECAEEAGIPAELAARSVGVGAVSYCTERPEGLRRDVEFIYDLDLPSDFNPINGDGEVDGFDLWPIDRVIETVRDTDAFKFNCALVVIDFLVRHGFIEPDHPDYVDLIAGLRVP